MMYNMGRFTAAPMEFSYKERYVFLPKDRYFAPMGVKICTIVEL